jgi:hypothetical protein
LLEDAMRHFLAKHGARIAGVLAGFDRLVFHGFLRGIGYAAGMESYLYSAGVLLKNFKAFARATSIEIIEASLAAAVAQKRPVIRLPGAKDDKQAEARKSAERDRIAEGLVCVLRTVEPCHSFNVVWDPEKGRYCAPTRTPQMPALVPLH